MHLFEAALAWEQPRPIHVGAPGDEVAELCLGRFMTPDACCSIFRRGLGARRRPAGTARVAGHQFEWAGLLEALGARRGREDVRAIARRLYRYGADHGIDPKRVSPSSAARRPVG